MDTLYTFRQRDNAGRLAASLASFSADDRTVAIIAAALKYEPQQLKQDMWDIYDIVKLIPKDVK